MVCKNGDDPVRRLIEHGLQPLVVLLAGLAAKGAVLSEIRIADPLHAGEFILSAIGANPRHCKSDQRLSCFGCCLVQVGFHQQPVHLKLHRPEQGRS